MVTFGVFEKSFCSLQMANFLTSEHFLFREEFKK